MNKLHLLLVIVFCALPSIFITAQTDDSQAGRDKKLKHTFTTFHLEARADFDYLGNYLFYENGTDIFDNPVDLSDLSSWQSNDYGFHGKYFNFLLGGNIGDHISYFLRQRIIPRAGSVNFFDNTDFLYVQYAFNKNWAVRLGKEALYIGGYEYDAPPIDVYYYTQLWSNIYCFQLGASVIFTDNSEKNKIVFQFANSPYIYYTGYGNEWKKGLFSYNLFWTGNYGPFSTLYSVNMMEYERGKFVNYISLGNKFSFSKCQFYFDYMNRASSFDHFFEDFTVVGRADLQVGKSVNLFAKAGYDQNKAEDYFTANPMDMMMTPGCSYYFYGLGLEVRPASYRDLRLHAFVANSVFAQPGTVPERFAMATSNHGCLNVNVGASWRIDFMKLLPLRAKQ